MLLELLNFHSLLQSVLPKRQYIQEETLQLNKVRRASMLCVLKKDYIDVYECHLVCYAGANETISAWYIWSKWRREYQKQAQ